MSKFVPESPAKTDEPFWVSGVNPITMIKEESLANVTTSEETSIDYDYQF